MKKTKNMKQGIYLDDISIDSSVPHYFCVGDIVLGIMRFLSIKQILDVEKTYGSKLPQETWIKYHHSYNPNLMRYAKKNGNSESILIIDQTSIGYVKSLSYDRLTKSAKYKIKWEPRDPDSLLNQNTLYDASEESLVKLSDIQLIDQSCLVEECKNLYNIHF